MHVLLLDLVLYARNHKLAITGLVISAFEYYAVPCGVFSSRLSLLDLRTPTQRLAFGSQIRTVSVNLRCTRPIMPKSLATHLSLWLVVEIIPIIRNPLQ